MDVTDPQFQAMLNDFSAAHQKAQGTSAACAKLEIMLAELKRQEAVDLEDADTKRRAVANFIVAQASVPLDQAATDAITALNEKK